MATRNLALDKAIIDSARTEFMTHGFKDASLHKIASGAHVTTGALYTRYASKDALFKSLVEPFFQIYADHMQPIHDAYEHAIQTRSLQSFMDAIEYEMRVSLELFSSHREMCILLFCKSQGSSVGDFLNQSIEQKVQGTIDFFSTVSDTELDVHALTILMHMQFNAYRQLLELPVQDSNIDLSLQIVLNFLLAGWRDLYAHHSK